MPWNFFPCLNDTPIHTGADMSCPQAPIQRTGEISTEVSCTVETKKRTGAVKEREENPEILSKKIEEESLEPVEFGFCL